jgi:casein kinase II subunit beta
LGTQRGSIFIEIDHDYLLDKYNLYGLRQKVGNFKYSVDLIRGPYLATDHRPREWPHDIDDFGLCLYGLLHARYLLTAAGQQKMLDKLREDIYPKCPRVLCAGCRCLPYGTSADIGQSNVKGFCPNCQDIYSIADDRFACMDGAFFGPTWVLPFLARYPFLVPPDPPQKYVPRIFGFRVAPPEAT